MAKVALSALATLLDVLGVPKSTVYNWADSGNIPGVEVVEERGQKYLYLNEPAKFKAWLVERLGGKGERIIEKVEQGIPFGKFEEAIEEIRKLEQEKAELKAKLLVLEKEKERLQNLILERDARGRELEERIKELQKELKEREKTARELEKKLKLKELEPIVGELPAEKRKVILKLLEEL